MDLLVFIVSLAAAVFSGAGLILMRQQLVAARAGTAARGLNIEIRPSSIVSYDADSGTEEPRLLIVTVEAAGTAKWPELQAHIVNRETGDSFSLWSPIAEFSAADGQVRGDTAMPTEEMRQCDVVLTWTEPWGLGARTKATRRAIIGSPARTRRRAGSADGTADGAETQLEDWQWGRFHDLRHWLQTRRRRRWLPLVGRPRPLGRWKPVRDRSYGPEQLPGWPW